MAHVFSWGANVLSGTPVDTKLDRSGTKTYPEAKTLASGAATGVGPGGAGVASGSPGELASSTGVNVKNEG